MAASSVARRARSSRSKQDRQAEADAWVQGAREQFEALIEMARSAPPGPDSERAVMRSLAVVGAALLQSLSSRRAAGASARRARTRRRTRSA